jgi:hypothetical protein
MAVPIQCENCGAILAEEDVFCGECGAPRASLGEVIEPAAGEPVAAPELDTAAEPTAGAEPLPDRPTAPRPSPPPPLERPSGSSKAGWRVAFFVLVGMGVIACLAALLAFLIVGLTEGDNTTPQEDWLIATLCCLLPVGGMGAALAAAGAAIWYTRLRDR